MIHYLDSHWYVPPPTFSILDVVNDMTESLDSNEEEEGTIEEADFKDTDYDNDDWWLDILDTKKTIDAWWWRLLMTFWISMGDGLWM